MRAVVDTSPCPRDKRGLVRRGILVVQQGSSENMRPAEWIRVGCALMKISSQLLQMGVSLRTRGLVVRNMILERRRARRLVLAP